MRGKASPREWEVQGKLDVRSNNSKVAQSLGRPEKQKKIKNFLVITDNFRENRTSLIRPSYTIKATIFEKVFQPEKFPKTENFELRQL